MEIYRATTIEEDGTLAIKGLPFAAGDKVQVIIRSQSEETSLREKYPLRGTVIRYTGPFEPAATNDWEALK